MNILTNPPHTVCQTPYGPIDAALSIFNRTDQHGLVCAFGEYSRHIKKDPLGTLMRAMAGWVADGPPKYVGTFEHISGPLDRVVGQVLAEAAA